jgi:hypothetical protein
MYNNRYYFLFRINSPRKSDADGDREEEARESDKDQVTLDTVTEKQEDEAIQLLCFMKLFSRCSYRR